MTVLGAVLVLLGVLGWPTGPGTAPATRPAGDEAARRSQNGAWRPGLLGSVPPSHRGFAGGPLRARDRDGVLALLDALGAALRAGLPPATALRCIDVSARSEQVGMLQDRLLAAADAAAPLAPVWAREAAALRSHELRVVARAWALSETLGSPLADCVGLAADLVRHRVAHERRLAIALAGPRATTTVLSLLPLAGPGVGVLLGIPPAGLYSGSAALLSGLLGLLLLGAGRWWCASLVARVSRPRAACEGA